MIKNIKKIVLLALAAVTVACLLAGCTLGPTFDGVIKDNNLVASVTYYANGGFFGGNLTEKRLWYTEGSRPVNIGGSDINVVSNPIAVSRSKYELGGWFYPQLDGSGNPVKDANGNVVVDQTKPLDTTHLMQSGEHIAVYALWLSEVKMDLIAVTDNGDPLTIVTKDAAGATVETEYQSGGVINSYSFGDKNMVQKPERLTFNVKDGAFTWSGQYFYDVACTSPVVWPIVPVEGSNENVPIYTRFIPGSWFIVNNADTFEDFVEESAIDTSVKGYMVSDVDYDGDRLSINYLNGELQGNGFKIKNFTVQASKSSDTLRNEKELSFITAVGANAKLVNVGFEGFTVKATIQPGTSSESKIKASIYALIGTVEDGASFEGVTFSSFTVNVSYDPDKSEIYNIDKDNGGAYVLNHYLFKGEEGSTDADFLAKYTGITVTVSADDVIITEK